MNHRSYHRHPRSLRETARTTSETTTETGSVSEQRRTGFSGEAGGIGEFPTKMRRDVTRHDPPTSRFFIFPRVLTQVSHLHVAVGGCQSFFSWIDDSGPCLGGTPFHKVLDGPREGYPRVVHRKAETLSFT